MSDRMDREYTLRITLMLLIGFVDFGLIVLSGFLFWLKIDPKFALIPMLLIAVTAVPLLPLVTSYKKRSERSIG